MSLAGIYRLLKPDLNTIEKRLEAIVASDEPILTRAANQLLKAGGKRIRPVFVLLSSQFGKGDASSVLKVAVTLELIHMASLVHDDVIDDADLRRGRKTVKAEWDNRIAMYTGDFMFARAQEEMTAIAIPEAHQVLSKAIYDMTVGEIIQIKDQYNWHQNLRSYLLRIKRKTALLMAVSCWLGAKVAGASDKVCRRLYYFGYFTGMSFQITDDILDFVGTEKELGKPAASDIRQGNLTLPTLMAFKDEALKADLLNYLIKSEQLTDVEWNDVIDKIRSSGGIEAAQRLSDRYLQKAYQTIEKLPKDVKATKFLKEIADYIGTRKY
jgi:heptaprenyl diphosphate synthase